MLYKSIFSKHFTNLNLNTFILENDLSTHLLCLLNLSNTPQLCPSLLLTYTFDVLDHIRQHNQLNTILYYYA